jgi:hypothetical protein
MIDLLLLLLLLQCVMSLSLLLMATNFISILCIILFGYGKRMI